MERDAGQCTISKSEMIEWQIDCNECGNRCKKTHNLKIHKCNKCGMNYCRKKQILRSENDRIASGLQSMLKEMQDNAKFQNQKMIEWLVDCNECGNRCNMRHNLKIYKCNKCGMNCRTTHNFKIRK